MRPAPVGVDVVPARESLRVPASLSVLVRGAIGLLFAAMILSSTYDKSGIVVGTTSVSVYKILFVALVVACLLDPFHRRPTRAFVQSPWRWVVAFAVVQTLASLVGALLFPEPWSIASEVYFLIQRSSFIVIPVVAWRYGLSELKVLKLFAAAVAIHYLFVLLQFVMPQLYAAFVEVVFSPLRPDNSRGWESWSRNFVGLQRTAAYGAFASLFGLVFLGFSPRSPWLRLGRRVMALAALLIAVFSGSRSVFLMMILTMLVLAQRTGRLRRARTYLRAGTLAAVIAGLFLAGFVSRENISSLDAFFSEERVESTVGKYSNAAYGWTLFQRSPLVGYGQRRFADLTYPLGNESAAQAESHSFVLSTVLATGLVGFLAYTFAAAAIVRRLWQRPGRDGAIVCALFVGLNLYNITYDTGALDLFACFNGVAAYYALAPKRDPNG